MRSFISSLLTSALLLLAACAAEPDDSEHDDAVQAPVTGGNVELQKIKDEMCACKDKACADVVKVRAISLGVTNADLTKCM